VANADLDTLQSLVEKSLLRYTNKRYWMLETIRDYADHCLKESTGIDELRRRQADWLLRLAEDPARDILGQKHVAWLEALEMEHPNFGETLRWLLASGDLSRAVRLGVGLSGFWHEHGHLREGRALLESTLAAPLPDPLRASLLHPAARLASEQGELAEARRFCEEAVVLAQQLRDERRLGSALELLGMVTCREGDPDEAHLLASEALRLYQAVGDARLVANVLNNLANISLLRGDLDEAEREVRECLELEQAAGHVQGIAFILHTGGYVALAANEIDRADARFQEALTVFVGYGDRQGIADSFEGLANVAARWGNGCHAAFLWGAGEALRQAVGADIQPSEHLARLVTLENAREAVGPDVFEREWTRGAMASWEQVARDVLRCS
jgi:tetratricopeptide (TPR) repeat protein